MTFELNLTQLFGALILGLFAIVLWFVRNSYNSMKAELEKKVDMSNCQRCEKDKNDKYDGLKTSVDGVTSMFDVRSTDVVTVMNDIQKELKRIKGGKK